MNRPYDGAGWKDRRGRRSLQKSETMIRYSKAPRGTGELILCAFVLFASGEAAADVALAFIQIQNLPNLGK